MHRSGTSALAGTLGLAGCDLPKTLMEPTPHNNEMGFWESQPIAWLNDELLMSAGSSWDSWLPFDSGFYASPVADGFRERARAMLREEYGDSRLFVLKDPRICRFLAFWIEALRAVGANVLVVSTVRNPADVAMSLAVRDGIDPSVGYLLWLRHMLDAEAASRRLRRAYVRYDTLLSEACATVDALGDALDVSWPRCRPAGAPTGIAEFLSPGLRHHRSDDAELLADRELSPWIRSSFEIFERWSHGEVHGNDTARLGRIRAAFDEAAPTLHHLVAAHERAVAERDDRIHAYERAIHAHERAVAERDDRIDGLNRMVERLQGSVSWRLTAPCRSMSGFFRNVAKQLSILFRYREQKLHIIALHDVERHHSGGWLSLGKDPQFTVIPERNRFPTRWGVMSYESRIPVGGLQLRMYVDSGEGYSEKMSIDLKSSNLEGKMEKLVLFPERVVAMRLDPMRIEGYLELQNISAREIGKFFLSIYVVRHLIRQHVKKIDGSRGSLVDLARKAMSAFIHSGPIEWKQRLIEDWDNHRWFRNYRISMEQIRRMEERIWTRQSPSFSIVVPFYNTPEAWIREAIESVLRQIYENWELICVDDGSSESHVGFVLEEFARRDPRIVCLANESNLGVSAASNVALRKATGDYICFMDHDDCLEPHALWRLSDAIVSDRSDFLYSDEVITSENIDHVIHVCARPAFSYDYYISHPYFTHLVAVKRSLAEELGGLDESLDASQDVDFNLRCLERAERVTHVPDILYRWRKTSKSLGHMPDRRVTETTSDVLCRHLTRLGFEGGRVDPGSTSNVFDIRFFPKTQERVAVIVPTKNRGDLLRSCVESLRATTEEMDFDLIIIDHDSDDRETQLYLRDLERFHRVIKYSGEFNFSKICNFAVEQIKGHYDYYLFMNNDIEATGRGWFEAMLDRAKRPDVGAVGAVLLYPNKDRVQHGGVIVGMCGTAAHAFRFWKINKQNRDCSLVATRDYSAVTAACMLMRAEAFHNVGGFDEKLPVGLNDTDLCLRIAERGYKTLNHANAVLIHAESATRGKSERDQHPMDSALFVQRYRHMVRDGDPYYSPLLSINDPKFGLRMNTTRCPLHVAPRTVTGFLPRNPKERRDD